jgi:hypothetical protein
MHESNDTLIRWCGRERERESQRDRETERERERERCWKCYRPRYSLTDTGEFVAGFGGPAGNGSFETAL